MKLLAFVVSAFVMSIFAAIPAYAAVANCQPIYGGGITKEQVCDGKKVTVSTQGQPKTTTTTVKSQTTTKGGLPVVSATKQNTTPSTGPEMLGIVALAPAAALGMYLRKKS